MVFQEFVENTICQMAPSSFELTTLRLVQTKELLRTTQLTHKEIAEQVGFGSEQTLYRVFRQNEGCSPKEWRQTAMLSLSSIET